MLRDSILKTPEQLMEVCSTIYNAGYQVYVVGGAVRDYLRGENPTDWDLATNARPEQVEALFPKTIPTGKQFGTITVVVGENFYEVTTFRKEGRYSDKRHPDEVVYTETIVDDLERRDFTINAIAYDPINQEYVDPFNGFSDLKRKLLRTVGDPSERFAEDPLRILRLLRFVATLEFRPERRTLHAIEPGSLQEVSKERIRDEFNKLLMAKKIDDALELMYTTGVMDIILPELAACKGVSQGDRHQWDVLGHSIVAAQMVKPSLHLRLAALFHDIAKPVCMSRSDKGIHFYRHEVIGEELTKDILTRLRYSSSIKESVSRLVRWHMFSIHPLSSDRAIRRFISKVGVDYIIDLLEIRRADILAQRFSAKQAYEFISDLYDRIQEILDQEAALTVKDLAINGDDIMENLNIPPGKQVGEIIKYLLDRVIDEPNLNEKEILIKLAKKYINTTY